MAIEQPPLPGAAPHMRVGKTIGATLGTAAVAAMAAALATIGIKPDAGKWNVAKRDFARGIRRSASAIPVPNFALANTERASNATADCWRT